jgi:hypothetical protein
MAMLLREIHDLRGLRFGDVSRKCAHDAVTLVVYVQHDLSRSGLVQMEKLHQDEHDELHRRVIIVVKDDDILLRLLDLGALGVGVGFWLDMQ